jgi:hypothetical protein
MKTVLECLRMLAFLTALGMVLNSVILLTQ